MNGTRATQKRWLWWLGGIAVLIGILLAFAAGWIGPSKAINSSVTAEAGMGDSLQILIVIMIFIILLAICAITFQGFGMQYQPEAFGLPAGTISALLALGLLILFGIYGPRMVERVLSIQSVPSTRLHTIRVGPAIGEVPEESTAAREIRVRQEADNQTQRLRGLGLVVVPEEVREPNGSFAIHLNLYEPHDNARGVSFAREFLTIVATLMTTIIGFYFGARSTMAAVTEERRPSGAAAGGAMAWGAPGATSLEAQRSRLTDLTRSLDAATKAMADTLTPLTAERKAQIKVQIDAADAARQAADTRRMAAETAVARIEELNRKAGAGDASARIELPAAQTAADQVLSGLAEAVAALDRRRNELLAAVQAEG